MFILKTNKGTQRQWNEPITFDTIRVAFETLNLVGENVREILVYQYELPELVEVLNVTEQAIPGTTDSELIYKTKFGYLDITILNNN